MSTNQGLGVSMSAEMTGEIRALAWEDGKDYGPDCGDEECECTEHEYPPRPAGTYITIRLDGHPPVGLWRVRVTQEPEAQLSEPDPEHNGKSN